MKSELKTKRFKSKALGRVVELRELSGLGQIEVTDASQAGASNLMVAAITCKHCVIEWREESAEDIAENTTMATLDELTEAIIELSGVRAAKNSVAGRVDASNSDSASHSG